jgi:hypothetical protein
LVWSLPSKSIRKFKYTICPTNTATNPNLS